MKRSAGLVVYRRKDEKTEIFLVHPGGPFWRNKEQHAWSIPKGLVEEGEADEEAARREFREETGFEAPQGEFLPLGEFKVSGEKIVIALAVEGEADPATVKSNWFEMEFPPRSGKKASFPEVDRAAWVPLEEAEEWLHIGQADIAKALRDKLS